jgi:hypothetical protein
MQKAISIRISASVIPTRWRFDHEYKIGCSSLEGAFLIGNKTQGV